MTDSIPNLVSVTNVDKVFKRGSEEIHVLGGLDLEPSSVQLEQMVFLDRAFADVGLDFELVDSDGNGENGGGGGSGCCGQAASRLPRAATGKSHSLQAGIFEQKNYTCSYKRTIQRTL